MKSFGLVLSMVYICIFTFCTQSFNNKYAQISGVQIKYYNEQTIEDLALLCKIWGFLKYYHPNVVKGKYDWDFELFEIIPLTINAKSRDKRNDVLSKWINRLGKVRQEKPLIINPDSVKMYPDIKWIKNKDILGEKIVDQLEKIRTAKRNGNILDYLEFKNNSHPSFKKEKSYAELSYPDVGFRLLSLFRYWNIIQYYYPYKYLIDENWQNILVEFIPQFIEAENELEYRLVISKLNSKIKDTHAIILDPILEKYVGRNIVPVEISFIEQKAIITNIFVPKNRSSYPLQEGDIINCIDNFCVDSIIKQRQIYISASNYPTLLRNIALDLLKTNKDKLLIEYERNGEILCDSIKCYPIEDIWIPSIYEKNKPCYQIIENNISYIYPASIEGGKIPDSIHTKGMIIDLRCYPSQARVKGYWEFLQLYPKPTKFAKFTMANKSTPGLFTFVHTAEVGKKNNNYYKNKKVILVNEITQSHSEFMAMKYRCSPNSIVLGSTTAGADGGVVKFVLPGGIWVFITGSGVYYPDGTETQQIGIVPDIEVKPTIKGIREGRDEVLEKAIELIEKDILNQNN